MRALRAQWERERTLAAQLLEIAGETSGLQELIREATRLLLEWSGCEAVGIRLRDGDDFPYFETRGFPPEFVQLENQLCIRDLNGQVTRDAQGDPVLDCMCGNTLCGRFDPALPFFTPRGSFWTNCTTRLLATTTDAQRLARTRNRCNGEGYESVALIPLRADGRTVGLVQLNDHRQDRFSADLIAGLESLIAGLAGIVARRMDEESLLLSHGHLAPQTAGLPLGPRQRQILYERAIHDSEQSLRVVADNTYDWEFWLSPEGRFRYVSPSCKRISGYDPAEFQADPDLLLRIVHPTDRNTVAKHLATTAPDRQEVEFRILTAESQWRWIGMASQSVFDAESRFLGKRGSNRDITDRKHRESLLLVERDLALALNQTRDVDRIVRLSLEAAIAASGLDGGGIYLVDPDSGRLQLKCHAGLSEEFVRAVSDYEPGSENAQIVARGVFLQIDEGAEPTAAVALARQHGMRAIAAVPVLHEGRPIACLNLGSRTAKRIAEHERHAMEAIAAQMGMALVRTRAEQSRQRVQEELRAIYDSSPIMMCVLDSQRCLLYLNRTLADFVGVSEEALRAQRACGLIGCVHSADDPRGCGYGPQCDACPLRHALQDTIDSGRGHRGIEHRLTLSGPDGPREVVLRASTAPIRSVGGMNVLLCLEDVTQHHQAEAALRQNEAKYRFLFENMTQGVFRQQADGTLVDANPAALRMLGVSRDQFVGRNVFLLSLDVVHEDGSPLPVLEHPSRQALMTGRPVHAVVAGIRHLQTGARVWLEINATPEFRPGEERPYQVLVTLHDISQRRRAEESLRTSEQRYRGLFEAESDAILMVDVDTGRFLEVNPAAQTLYGYTKQEFLGMTAADVSAEPDNTRAAIAARQTSVPLRWHRRRDGTTFPVEISAAYFEQHGRRLHVAAIRDITERRRAEAALRESEALLSTAETIAESGSFTWDIASDTCKWSKGMAALSGLDSRMTLSFHETATRTVHPDDLQRVREEIGRMVAAQRAWPMEFRIVRPDGAVRLIHSTGEFIFDEQGGPLRVVASMIDITQRRADEDRLAALRSQLNHASRLATLGELTAGIAHEVNQPLCSIVNFAKACKNLAVAPAPDVAQIARWADAAAQSASRAGDIVRGLSRFARLHSERVVRPVRQLVQDAILLVQHEAKVTGVAIRLSLGPHEPQVHVEEVPIQQVLVNLLRNGIEALSTAPPRPRQIVVDAVRDGQYVAISVSDNGPGLDAPSAAKLFEPFFSTKSNGLGLGLAISRTIVEDHGGKIWAHPNPEGGLTVQFTLPVQKDHP
jgi:PAS domain S-box-containing protein